MTPCNRTTRRLTAIRDQRTGRLFVIELTSGGVSLRIRPLGHRTGYVVPYAAIWLTGAKLRAAEIAREKAERKTTESKP